MSDVIVLGSGGHARAVVALAEQSTEKLLVSEYVSKTSTDCVPFRDMRFVSEAEASLQPRSGVILNGIGLSVKIKQRHMAFLTLLEGGYQTASLLSKYAYIDKNATKGTGIQVFQMAVIQSGSHVGNHAVIGAGAIVEHDAVIGDYSFISPGAIILGGAIIEEYVTVFAGATILPGVRIGRGSVVGAGSIVLSDVPRHELWVGNPAGRLREVNLDI